MIQIRIFSTYIFLMKIILILEISLHIISLHESFRCSSFSLQIRKIYCFCQHKICYLSIHKNTIALNKIRKYIIVFIFIVETIEEEEK